MTNLTLGPRERRRQAALDARMRYERRTRYLVGMLITAGGTALALYALPMFVIIYGGMLPSLVAYLMDEQPSRYLFRTVAAMNLAGLVPFVEPAWRLGTTLGLVGYPVSDMRTWTIIYGSAIAGFGLAWVTPVITNIFLEASYRARLKRLEQLEKDLMKEWNLSEEKLVVGATKDK
jgi:uncharacterized membrane protein